MLINLQFLFKYFKSDFPEVYMYAIIDIGSNTIRMVLYKVINNEIQQMLNSKIPAGLAGYIDNNNMLSKKGILKAIEALSKFQIILESVAVRSSCICNRFITKYQ